MLHFETFADSASIVRPVCSKCGAPLWLTRIEPDKPGFARRTFECPRCKNQMTEIVQLDKADGSHGDLVRVDG